MTKSEPPRASKNADYGTTALHVSPDATPEQPVFKKVLETYDGRALLIPATDTPPTHPALSCLSSPHSGPQQRSRQCSQREVQLLQPTKWLPHILTSLQQLCFSWLLVWGCPGDLWRPLDWLWLEKRLAHVWSRSCLTPGMTSGAENIIEASTSANENSLGCS